MNYYFIIVRHCSCCAVASFTRDYGVVRFVTACSSLHTYVGTPNDDGFFSRFPSRSRIHVIVTERIQADGSVCIYKFKIKCDYCRVESYLNFI